LASALHDEAAEVAMRKLQTFTLALVMLGVASASSSVKAETVFVEVGTRPVEIERYPHTWHRGHRVYYYDGHWYYRRAPRHWGYYRDEPRVLYEYRSNPRHHVHERVIERR
jgi:hypothetical protein